MIEWEFTLDSPWFTQKIFMPVYIAIEFAKITSCQCEVRFVNKKITQLCLPRFPGLPTLKR